MRQIANLEKPCVTHVLQIGHISNICKFKKVNFTMQKIQEPSSNWMEDINKKLQDFCLCVFGDDYIKRKVAIMNRCETLVRQNLL